MTAADLVERAASTATAITVLAGVLWWLFGPRVREYLRAQGQAAATIAGSGDQPSVRDQLGVLTATVQQHLLDSREGWRKLDRLADDVREVREAVADLREHQEATDAELADVRALAQDVDQRVSEFLAEAAAELRLARAAHLLAAGQRFPPELVPTGPAPVVHHHHHPTPGEAPHAPSS